MNKRGNDFSTRSTSACLVLLVWLSSGLIAQGPGEAGSSAEGPPIRATHLLGLKGLSNGANGKLSIQAGVLRFQRDEGPAAQISIGSIQDTFLGEQDKQVGGVPMALGQAATPFGGGRVIALFSHKKYDTLTLEYVDPNGGLNGVIFQLNKGQGQVFRDQLMTERAHATDGEHQASRQTPSEITQPRNASSAVKSSAGRDRPVVALWSVQIRKVDTGDVNLEPAFRVAIYENLLDELTKTKRFKRVFRSGDRNASESPDLLILKTTVENYKPGSETRRAVTTVSGATKLKVRTQLCSGEDKPVLEKVVDGNVRLFGGNLRVTHNVAHNIADSLKRSTLPEPTR